MRSTSSDPSAYHWVNSGGINLQFVDGGSEDVDAAGRIINRVSINMTPFKTLRIRAASFFYRGSDWINGRMRIQFLKANHTTSIRYTDYVATTNGLTYYSFDISDINEQAYFVIIIDSTRTDTSGDGGLGGNIAQIDFLTT